MMTKTKMQQRTPSDPTTWATDPTTWARDITRPTNAPAWARPSAAGDRRPRSMSAMTPAAPIAASGSAQGATGDDDTATRPVPSAPTGNGSAMESAPRPSPAGSVDSATTKLNTTLTQCEQCGRDFAPKTSRGRFCCAYCRRRAWLARNPEKAVELAERDRARLKACVLAHGGVWVERRDDGTHGAGHSAVAGG